MHGNRKVGLGKQFGNLFACSYQIEMVFYNIKEQLSF